LGAIVSQEEEKPTASGLDARVEFLEKYKALCLLYKLQLSGAYGYELVLYELLPGFDPEMPTTD
jgi:hypothetical protein